MPERRFSNPDSIFLFLFLRGLLPVRNHVEKSVHHFFPGLLILEHYWGDITTQSRSRCIHAGARTCAEQEHNTGTRSHSKAEPLQTLYAVPPEIGQNAN